MDDPDSGRADCPPLNDDSYYSDTIGVLDVAIVDRHSAWCIDQEFGRKITALVHEALAASGKLGDKFLTVSVVLSCDEEMQGLNANYRGKIAPTNVLSFPSALLEVPCNEPLPLGDVVLGYETVNREAKQLKIDLRHHAYHLIVHGVLHLVGFDHDDDETAEAMETLEADILAAQGLRNPYMDANRDGENIVQVEELS